VANWEEYVVKTGTAGRSCDWGTMVIQWMSLRMTRIGFGIWRTRRGCHQKWMGYVTRMALIWPIEMLEGFRTGIHCIGASTQFLGRMREFWFLTTHWPVTIQRDRWQLFAEIRARHKVTSTISLPFDMHVRPDYPLNLTPLTHWTIKKETFVWWDEQEQSMNKGCSRTSFPWGFKMTCNK